MRISLAVCLPENISGGEFTREYLWRSIYQRISLAECLPKNISDGGLPENISDGGFT